MKINDTVIDGVRVVTCAISAGLSRREAETAAVRELMDHAFGPGVAYGHDEHGAPQAVGRAESISVSHCRDLCVLAVRSAGAVGIDVEQWRDQLRRVAHKFLTPRERGLYADSPECLLRCWTAKEATFKAASMPGLTVSGVEVWPAEGVTRVGESKFTLRYLGDFPRLIAVVTPV